MKKSILFATATLLLAMSAPLGAQDGSRPTAHQPRQTLQKSKTSVDDISRDQVIQVQQALTQKGYYSGRADGIFGPETKRALTEFQRAQRLPVSGRIDDRSLAALKTGQADDQQSETGKAERPAGVESLSPGQERSAAPPPSEAPSVSPGQERSAAPPPSEAPSVGPIGSVERKSGGEQEPQSSSPSSQPSSPNQRNEPVADEGATGSWWRALWQRIRGGR